MTMKQLLTILIAMLLTLTASSQTLCRPSKYVYGRYGLESYPRKNNYAKYIGKVFTYMPASPALYAERRLEFAGKPGDKCEIVKITTNDEGTREMDVFVHYKVLKEDGTKGFKVYKNTLYNYNDEPSIWQAPFVFMDDVNKEVQNSIGKTFTQDDIENTFEIIDVKFEKLDESDEHPGIVYYVKDSYSGKTIRMSYMDKGSADLGDVLFEQENEARLIRVESSQDKKGMEGPITRDYYKEYRVYQYSDSLFDIKIGAYGATDYMPPKSLVLYRLLVG